MNRKIFYSRKNRNRKGFTLAEMLMTVAIIVILFALAVPAIFAIQRNLRQKELDSKAEIIYTAVQDRLTEIYGKGNTSMYDPDNNSGIFYIGDQNPDGYERPNDGETQKIYFFMKGSDVAKNIVKDNVLEDSVSDGYWIVEMIPYASISADDNGKPVPNQQNVITAPSVFAVYYSEDVDITENGQYQKDTKITEKYLIELRDPEKRKNKECGDAKIGYYGGSSAGSGSSSSSISVTSAVINSQNEINTAVAKIIRPTGKSKGLIYTFTFTDDFKHQYTLIWRDGTWTQKCGGNGTEQDVSSDYIKKFIESKHMVQNYTFTFNLDNLKSQETRFTSMLGSDSGHGDGNLVEGSNIHLKVEAQCTVDQRVSKDSRDASGNGIFAYVESNDGKVATERKAYISNARHLQNLDQSSNVKKAGKAYEKSVVFNTDLISFAQDKAFYEAYADQYFNGTVEITDISSTGEKTSITVPDFKSIDNDAITEMRSDNSQIVTIKNLSTSGSGLFAKAYKPEKIADGASLTIQNINLVGLRVKSEQTSGGFIGSVDKGASVKISNSQVYLSTESGDEDIPSTISSAMGLESVRWINGSVTGGFIGENSGKVTIEKASVSTVLGNKDGTTGGFVGRNNGTVTINQSYTDSYLYGLKAGGFIGESNGKSSVNNCYTAGFIGLDQDEENAIGAGFVNGASDITNAYSIIACYNVDPTTNGILRQSENGLTSVIGSYWSTAAEGTMQNVYYLKGSINRDNLNTTEAFSDGNTIKEIFGKANTANGVEVNKYQLMGQSLLSYDYPTLKDLKHYGDWTANFVPGALVYYEVYSDGSVGFEGANLDVSLLGDKDIIGDGYGVIYGATGENPSSVNVTLGSEKPFTINLSATNDNRKEVNVNGSTYYIYPFDKKYVNPDNAVSDFYEKVTLEPTGGDSSSKKEYYFNPHFARTVSATGNIGDNATVRIRSPRHLYNLSNFYDNGYRTIQGIKTYQQERDMIYSVYNWKDYYKDNVEKVTEQKSIGRTDSSSFDIVYDGGYYRIGDVSFYADSETYVGMFGTIGKDGNVRNVVLATQYSTDANANTYRVYRATPITRNTYVYEGVLVGYNKGQIDNCAVAGYYLAQKGSVDGTIYGYENSHLYIGGFAGRNDGTITNCSADNPKLSLNMFRAECYAGGFVGYNYVPGQIINSYALTNITSQAREGHTVIAGFAGYNSSTINRSYCASALTSSGNGSTAHAFGSREGDGFTRNSYYLAQGSYRFIDGLYTYGNGGTLNDSSTDSESNTTGTARTYDGFVDLAKTTGQLATKSSFNQITASMSSSAEVNYPFRAVVKNSSNAYVHYGEWVVEPALGNYGVFYWEHEENGENNGYKFTYVGFLDTIGYSHSTLCDAHDDGGIITEYGYGYYVSSNKLKEDPNYIQLQNSQNIIVGTQVNETVKNELEKQMPGITFFPYVTSSDGNRTDRVCLSDTITNNGSTVRNGVWTLAVGTGTNQKVVNFTISPFFANAIAIDKPTDESMDIAGIDSRFIQEQLQKTIGSGTTGQKVSYYKNGPGRDDNPYEIRSAQQLQFINWNGATNSTTNLVTADESNYKNFNYLMYTDSTNNSKQSRNTNNSHWENSEIKFLQTHDVKQIKNSDGSIVNFTPIAGQATSSKNTGNDSGYCAVLYAWFGGSFDGQSYKIEDLNITSNSFTVGLFGTEAGAKIQNVIMYSENNATIQRSKISDTDSDPDGAYAIGGLVGIAYNYADEESNPEELKNYNITNCAIAGYRIIDASTNKQTQGEANVGGLIGVSNISLENCSAVTDIIIKCTHKSGEYFTKASWGNHIRVGGLTGAVQYQINNCYTGGNISVEGDVLNESYYENTQYWNSRIMYDSKLSTNDKNSVAVKNSSTNIFISGIAGSAFAMNYRNFTGASGLREGAPVINNCYTYINFPDMEGTIRSISMIGTLADRYLEANSRGKTKSIKMSNCFYLSDSANFSIEKTPQYQIQDQAGKDYNKKSVYTLLHESYDYDYSKGGKNNWPDWFSKVMEERGTTSMSLKELMIRGDDAALSYIFNQWTSGTDWTNKKKNTLCDVNSKLYSELSSEIFKDKLGSDSWNFVTSKDKYGQEINGKYSFNTGKSELSGKNYPFPTVVKEDENNVHYGAWPTYGPHWSAGTASMDIFDDMNMDTGISEKEFAINIEGDAESIKKVTDAYNILKSDGNTMNTPGALKISEVDDTEEDEHIYTEEISKDDVRLDIAVNKIYVKIRANQVGSAKILAKWGDTDSCSFTLNITANMNVSIDGDTRSFILAPEQEQAIHAHLMASSVENKDFTNRSETTWEATSSHDTDDLVADVGVSQNVDANGLMIPGSFTLTGTGLNGSVTLKATYKYKESEYSSSIRLTIRKQDFIGLSDNSHNWEVSIPAVGNPPQYVATDEKDTYTDNTRPSYTSNYYLYEFSTSNLLESSELNAYLIDDISGVDAPIEGTSVTFDQRIDENENNVVTLGDYKYLGLNINTDGVRRDIVNPKLVVKVNSAYTLTMELGAIDYPYVLTFTDDDSVVLADEVVVNDTNKQKVNIVPKAINEDDSDVKYNLKTPGNGYVLEGWYTDVSGFDENGNEVINKVKVLEADGTVVEQADGFVENGSLNLQSHFVTLHPKWVQYEYSNVTELNDDSDYLVLNRTGTATSGYQYNLYQNELEDPNNENSKLKSIEIQNVSFEDLQLKFDPFDDIRHYWWKKQKIDEMFSANKFGTSPQYYAISEVEGSGVYSYNTAITPVQDDVQQNTEELAPVVTEQPVPEEMPENNGEEIAVE